MLWETRLTAGLVSVILGTSSGAQNVGQMNAVAVAAYIALASLWGAPVSGASMNTARSLGPALILGTAMPGQRIRRADAGSVIAVAIAYVLRGRGGGFYGKKAAQGGLGWLWSPGNRASCSGFAGGGRATRPTSRRARPEAAARPGSNTHLPTTTGRSATDRRMRSSHMHGHAERVDRPSLGMVRAQRPARKAVQSKSVERRPR